MVGFPTIILGISFAIIAMICFSLAAVFQKKGIMEGLPEIKIENGIKELLITFKEFIKNKTWIIGFSLGVIGWFPYIISMGLVGILVAQPITSMGLIIFVIAAIKMLHEKISVYELISIAMLGSAPFMIAVSGISDVKIDIYQFAIPFIIFIGILIGVTIICFYISKKKRGTKVESIYLMFTGAIPYAIGAIFTNVLAQAFSDANVGITWYFPFEFLFGIFWFDYAHIWLFIAVYGTLIFNVASIAFVQSALQKGRAVVVMPILNSFALILPIIAGLFVFNQTFANIYLFLITIVLILIATISLSKFQAKIETIEAKKEITENKKGEIISEEM